MTTYRLFARCAVLALGLLAALAQAAGDEPPGRASAERERIRRERAQAEAKFSAAMKACGERFVVTGCADEARAERRGTLEHLAREQGVIDDAERRQRAASRMRRIQDKMREADQRAAAPAPARASAPAPRAPAPRHVTRSAAPAPRDPEAAAHEAAARRAAHERRAQEAQAHREQVEQRNAARAAKKKPAAPLPAPAASANKP